MANKIDFEGTTVDLDEVAAVTEPDGEHVVRLRLKAGGVVKVKARKGGKERAKKLHADILDAWSRKPASARK